MLHLPTGPTGYRYVVVDDTGIPYIEGTSMKVEDLVVSHLFYGWTLEDLEWQHPEINLAHLHAALAYYYDHKKEIDRRIAKNAAGAQNRNGRRSHPLEQ